MTTRIGASLPAAMEISASTRWEWRRPMCRECGRLRHLGRSFPAISAGCWNNGMLVVSGRSTELINIGGNKIFPPIGSKAF